MNKYFSILFAMLFVQGAFAQSSTFDINAEGWLGAGDPASTIPDYFNMGGNPGGYIRINDAAVGGLWYFLPPPKFQGNRCDAYGKFMRFDQFTNDTMGQSTFKSAWDIMIEGGNGQNLIWDHGDDMPGEDWTHYDILLKEDAGWTLQSTSIPPTEAEFRAILGDIDRIRILGEYHVGFDYGGMDNFVFESNYQLDLDENDSTTDLGSWNFWADSTCNTTIGLVDDDLSLAGDPVFSEIKVILPPFGFDSNLETLILNGNVPSSITVLGGGTDTVIFVNNGMASNADFEVALQTIFFNTSSANPSPAVRVVRFEGRPDCGDGFVEATAFLPLYPTPPAGIDQTLDFCPGDGVQDMRAFFGNEVGKNGRWSPSFKSNSFLFDPELDIGGLYYYITSGGLDCVDDTAVYNLRSVPIFTLGSDTLLCQDSALLLTPNLADYDQWMWEDGSVNPERRITEAGQYSLQAGVGTCLWDATVRVDFTPCSACLVYAPNVFKPDLSGLNDNFQIFPSCMPQNFSLRIFDRYGSLVFESTDSGTPWFGLYKGKKAQPGVYVWLVRFEAELEGAPVLIEEKGDLLLMR